MKGLQKSFKELLLLEIRVRDLYMEILKHDIADKETAGKIEFIKNQEIGHIIIAKRLLKIAVKAELRKEKPKLSKKITESLKGDIFLKRILLEGVVKLLDAKVRTFALLNLLGKKAAKFKKADKARQELTKIIAHELKTPLTVSNWISEIFLKKNKEKLTDDEKEMIERIRSANKTMFSFVDDLLALGRIEEAKKIKKEKVELAGVVREVLGELKYLIENQRQKVIFKCFKNEVIIYSNEKLLRKIVSNLLSNAVNYGREGMAISVKIEKFGTEKILFSVADNGIGIPRKEQKDIFKKFFRASNAKNIYQKGTGLGLYLIKELTKKLGGRIWFKSRENKGTTFYIELPG